MALDCLIPISSVTLHTIQPVCIEGLLHYAVIQIGGSESLVGWEQRPELVTPQIQSTVNLVVTCY